LQLGMSLLESVRANGVEPVQDECLTLFWLDVVSKIMANVQLKLVLVWPDKQYFIVTKVNIRALGLG
ncbi:hypothetical protein, partial [Pseudomonas luteola]|uniref:hypothetical protein n=1 Tax=Pseudomonas luteola TaxID=47886 RepID=UPI0028A195C2